jgi:hypothetical protein
MLAELLASTVCDDVDASAAANSVDTAMPAVKT